MSRRVRIAATADLHCGKNSRGQLRPLFDQAAAVADLLLLCGDLTDHGNIEEAEVLARELTGVKVPMLGVLGNHDHHAGHAAEVEKILEDVGLRLLDGDDCELLGIGFAGVKGFGGGFGRHTLDAWGEDIIKRFVYEAVEESLKLEKALARLTTPTRVALLHYAPIQATVENEPPAIFPFLGSSRLEEPLARYDVTAVFHGHAHHGSPRGQLRTGAPVYNVSLPLLRQQSGEVPPLCVVEIEAEEENREIA